MLLLTRSVSEGPSYAIVPRSRFGLVFYGDSMKTGAVQPGCGRAQREKRLKMIQDEAWRDFIRQCATDVIAGRLTTQQLRQALKDPRLRSRAMHHDFRLALVKVCEEISPLITHQRSLMLEIIVSTVLPTVFGSVRL